MGNPEAEKKPRTNLELIEVSIANMEANGQIDPENVTEITWRDLPLQEIENSIRDGKDAKRICEELDINPTDTEPAKGME